jgi:AcrR family transcriptional regulator
VAAEAGVTKVLLYRHFDSKADLYQAVLDHVRDVLHEAVGDITQLDYAHLVALVAQAARDPDGYRLLFVHAAREPRFREFSEAFRSRAVNVTEHHLAGELADPEQRRWAAQVILDLTIRTIASWLDHGQPVPQASVVGVIERMSSGFVEAVRAGEDTVEGVAG